MSTIEPNQMMKQWQFTKSGSPRDVLTMSEAPVPTTCADDEVLVRISHVALTSAMIHRLMAYYGVLDPMGALIGRPCVPEMDFSGVICDLRGKHVDEFHTGDRVFGVSPPGFRNVGRGVLREYILIKRDLVVKVPSHVSLKDAACFPATAYTAYAFLVEKAQLQEGQNVFIHGGSGAVGIMAVQLARTIVGPTGLVVATCSTAKRELVRSLGADEVIDYTAHSLPDYLREHYSSRPFDVILDTVGTDHALYSNSPAYLTPSGLFCTIGMVEIGSTVWSATKRLLQLMSAMVVPVYLGGVPRRHSFEPLGPVRERTEAMAKLVEVGAVKAVIDSTYKFADALDAYDRMMSRQVTGRVLIEVNDLE